ncbi:MAG: DMT family transporter [Deltaproteobacteria bacterium]|jgi:drug/metabolite transporter (DMT)-like permease|nr:DMT family transporter [Deltaproteobacteria bacterium]MCW8892024.1 DMT family transporter [Deltaproteobacteria bacterium]
MSSQSNFIIYLKLLLMATFWGGTFIAGRLLAGEVSPFSAAFLRFSIASLVLVFLTLRSYGKLPAIKSGQWLPLVLLGLSGIFAYNAFFFKGLELIEAGRAAVIIANNPIFIGLFATLIFKEKLNFQKVLGIILSIFGAVIVITHGHPTMLLLEGIGKGELYIFGSVASWVTYSLVGRAALKGFSPLVAVTYSAVIGTILLFPFACVEGLLQNIQTYSIISWASLFYLGLFGTVLGFVWYYQGIKKIGSTRAGQFINFVPVSAVLLSVWILDEPLTLSLLFGLLFVSGGVYLTNRFST